MVYDNFPSCITTKASKCLSFEREESERRRCFSLLHLISLNLFIGTISSLAHEDRRFTEGKDVKKREREQEEDKRRRRRRRRRRKERTGGRGEEMKMNR